MTLTARDPRRPLVEELHARLEHEPGVLAAWLGGSDATGRTDPRSDVDLVVLVEDDAVDRAFVAAEEAIQRLAKIARFLRLPEPTWHGHSQSFYQLDGWDEAHMVDFVVIRRSGPRDRFLEPSRHGAARVLFDPQNLVRAEELDLVEHEAKVRARRDQLLLRFALFQHLVEKSIRRGDAAEAMDRYMSLTLRPLVELLRIRFCPRRFDFGLRYLDRDLPRSLHREIAALAMPGGDLAALASANRRALALWHATRLSARFRPAGLTSLRYAAPAEPAC